MSDLIEWKPIDTAPRDGAEILIFEPGSRIGGMQETPDRVYIGFWRKHAFVHQSDDHLGIDGTMWAPLPWPIFESAR